VNEHVFFWDHEVGSILVVKLLHEFIVCFVEIFCSFDFISLKIYWFIYGLFFTFNLVCNFFYVFFLFLLIWSRLVNWYRRKRVLFPCLFYHPLLLFKKIIVPSLSFLFCCLTCILLYCVRLISLHVIANNTSMFIRIHKVIIFILVVQFDFLILCR